MTRNLCLSVIAISLFLAPRAALATAVLEFAAGFESMTLDFPVSGAVLADVDRDGSPDLLATYGTDTSNPQSFSVQRGLGSGRFAPAVSYTTGLYPTAIATGDLNGDQWQDVVVTSRASSSISVFLNRGDGTFHPRSNVSTGPGPRGIAIGDLDNDGDLDVVTANPSAGTISLLLGDGAGGFAPRVDRSSGSDVRGARLVDWNGDGVLDVLAPARGSSAIAIHLGNGDGTMAPVQLLTQGKAPLALDASDVDGDGRPDLAVLWSTGSSVSLFRRLPNGGLAYPIDLALAGSPSAIRIQEVTNDGQADFIVTSAGLDTTPDLVSIFPGLGNGSFSARRDVATGGDPSLLVIGDLDQSGWRDLVVGCSGSLSLAVHLANGLGGFGTKRDLTRPDGPGRVVVADFDEDNRPDLLAAGAQALSFWRGHGDGTFAAATSYTTPANVEGRLAIGDLNSDGHLDAVTVNPASVWIHFGTGAGTFSSSIQLALPVTGILSVATSDLDRDGRLDVVIGTTSNGYGNVFFMRQTTPGLWETSWGGRWFSAQSPHTHEIATGDFSGDGFPDVLISSQQGEVIFFRSKGGELFAPAALLMPNALPRAKIAIGDFNLDGKLDFAVTESATMIGIHLGDGDANFTRLAGIRSAGGLSALEIVDLDLDGVPDLVAAGGSVSPVGPNCLSLFRGLGDGTFAPRIDAGVNLQPNSIAASDLNGDGWFDLVAGSTPIAILDNQLAPVVGVPPAPGVPGQIALGAPSPNPTRGAIACAVTLPEAGTLALHVFDVAGRRVAGEVLVGLSAGPQRIRVDTARLGPGLYFLRASLGAVRSTTRFVVLP